MRVCVNFYIFGSATDWSRTWCILGMHTHYHWATSTNTHVIFSLFICVCMCSCLPCGGACVCAYLWSHFHTVGLMVNLSNKWLFHKQEIHHYCALLKFHMSHYYEPNASNSSACLKNSSYILTLFLQKSWEKRQPDISSMNCNILLLTPSKLRWKSYSFHRYANKNWM